MARSDNWRINKSPIQAVEGALVIRALNKVAGLLGLPSDYQVTFSTESEDSWNLETEKEKKICIGAKTLLDMVPISAENFDIMVGILLHEIKHTFNQSAKIKENLFRGFGMNLRDKKPSKEARGLSLFHNIAEDILIDGQLRKETNISSYYLDAIKRSREERKESLEYPPNNLLARWIDATLGGNQQALVDTPDELVDAMTKLMWLSNMLYNANIKNMNNSVNGREVMYSSLWSEIRELVLNPVKLKDDEQSGGVQMPTPDADENTMIGDTEDGENSKTDKDSDGGQRQSTKTSGDADEDGSATEDEHGSDSNDGAESESGEGGEDGGDDEDGDEGTSDEDSGLEPEPPEEPEEADEPEDETDQSPQAVAQRITKKLLKQMERDRKKKEREAIKARNQAIKDARKAEREAAKQAKMEAKRRAKEEARKAKALENAETTPMDMGKKKSESIGQKLLDEIMQNVQSETEDISAEVIEGLQDGGIETDDSITVLRKRETGPDIVKPDMNLVKRISRILGIRVKLQSRTLYGELEGKLDMHHLHRCKTDTRIYKQKFQFPTGFPDTAILLDFSGSISARQKLEILSAASALHQLLHCEVWCYASTNKATAELVRLDDQRAIHISDISGGTPSGEALMGLYKSSKAKLFIHLTDGDYNYGISPLRVIEVMEDHKKQVINILWDGERMGWESATTSSIKGLYGFPDALYEILVDKLDLAKM